MQQSAQAPGRKKFWGKGRSKKGKKGVSSAPNAYFGGYPAAAGGTDAGGRVKPPSGRFAAWSSSELFLSAIMVALFGLLIVSFAVVGWLDWRGIIDLGIFENDGTAKASENADAVATLSNASSISPGAATST